MTDTDDFIAFRNRARAVFPILAPAPIVGNLNGGPYPSWEHFNTAGIPQYHLPDGYNVKANQASYEFVWHECGHEIDEALTRRDPTKAHHVKFLAHIGNSGDWDALKAAADRQPTARQQHDADPGEWWAEAMREPVRVDGPMRAFFQSLIQAAPAATSGGPNVLSAIPPVDPTAKTIVVDYFSPHGRTLMDCLRGEGVSGIARYLTNSPTDARQVTESEITDAHAAGHAVLFFYEMNPTYPAYFTFAQGAEDCRQAIERLRELRAPLGTVVYFAVDTNIEPSIADEYFNGIESMATPQLVPGVYGYERMIEHARAHYPNVGKHLAQTYGTPRGPLDLWQHEQKALCGVAVDLNECSVAGWRPMEEDMLTEERIREWAKEETRAVLSQEYGPALEAELTQRLADNSAGDVGAAVAAAVKAVGEKLTKP